MDDIKTINKIISNINIDIADLSNIQYKFTDVSVSKLINNNVFNFNYDLMFSLITDIRKLTELKTARQRFITDKIPKLSIILPKLSKILNDINKIHFNDTSINLINLINSINNKIRAVFNEIYQYLNINTKSTEFIDITKSMERISNSIENYRTKRLKSNLNKLTYNMHSCITLLYKKIKRENMSFKYFKNINYFALDNQHYNLLNNIDIKIQEYVNTFINIDNVDITYLLDFINKQVNERFIQTGHGKDSMNLIH